MANLYHVFWFSLAVVFTLIGLIGLILPVIPTVPFLLLASACLFRGSKKLHKKLSKIIQKNSTYMHFLKKNKRKAYHLKTILLFFVWVYSAYLFIFIFPGFYSRLSIFVIVVSVTIYINTVKYLDW